MKDAVGRVQSVLVVGATSDLARAVSAKLAQGGTRRFVLAGRDQARLGQVVEELRAAGATEVVSLPFEATRFESHGPMIEQAFSRGDIDVVLLAFGVLGHQATDEHDPLAAAQVMQVNGTAAVSVGTAAAEALRRQGHGSLVALSSVAGERARRSNFVYGASKAAMDAYFQGLAAALAPEGVEVVVVRPGFVRTRMTEGMKPAPFATTPEAVAAAVVAAVGRGTGTVWVPAPLRLVMTVLRHLPTPLFRRLPL